MTSNTLQCHLCQVVLADNESTIKQHISSRHLNYRPFDCNTCKEEDNSFQAATEDGMDAHIAISHSATNSGYQVTKEQIKETELKAAIEECRRASTLQLSSADTTIARNKNAALNKPADIDENVRVTRDSKELLRRGFVSRGGTSTDNGNISTEMKQKNTENQQYSTETAIQPPMQSSSYDSVVKPKQRERNLPVNERNNRMETTSKRKENGKPFKCSQCSFASAYKSNLDNHVRNHTGDKPFKCSQCSYACAKKSNLDLHVRTHTGEKPFKCDQCSYASVQKSALDNHVRNHTGDKPFKCDQCSYATAHKATLARHVRNHTGKKPYKCDQCSYASAYKGALDRHVRIHTGEKPFKCDQCSYATALKGNLDVHVRTHTG